MSDNNVHAMKNLQRMHRPCSESGKRDQLLLEDGGSGSKRARVSEAHCVNIQNGDLPASTGSSPFGLNFDLSPSFVISVNRTLRESKQVHPSSNQNQGSCLKNPPKARRAASRSSDQKLKASNLEALHFRIGSWQKQSSHGGELAVKVYYAKRRLVWEILEGSLKCKIEIEWTDIMAIRAFSTDTHGQEVLEIQLKKPPCFYRENIPQPRRHTSWSPVSDFTGGQATLMRRHLVAFPPRVFEKHYKQLLSCDERLFALSQRPFPDQECPFFDSSMFVPPQHSLRFDGGQMGFESTIIQPSPNPTVPAMSYPSQPTFWDQGTYLPEANVGFQDNSITQVQGTYLPEANVGFQDNSITQIQGTYLPEGNVINSTTQGQGTYLPETNVGFQDINSTTQVQGTYLPEGNVINSTTQGQGAYLPEGTVGFQVINSITQGQDMQLSCEDYGTNLPMPYDPQNGLSDDGGQVLFSDDETLLAQLEADFESYFHPTSPHLNNNNLTETSNIQCNVAANDLHLLSFWCF